MAFYTNAEKSEKKKSRATRITLITSGVVVIALAVVLIVTNVFGLVGKKAGRGGDPWQPTPGNTVSDSPIVGTWHGMTQSIHGNGVYIWCFSEDGRFAFLYSGLEPPSGGIDIFSVREVFMQGNYHDTGSAIECYDARVDDYLAQDNKGFPWKYFPERDPGYLADVLLSTPLLGSEGADNFSIDYEMIDAVTFHFSVDCGVFPFQYDMDFVK